MEIENYELTCDICDKTFEKKDFRDSHINRVHKKLRPYTWDFCSKCFFNTSDLQKHGHVILGTG